MLDRGGPSALDTTDSAERDHAVEATVAASLTMLDDSIPGCRGPVPGAERVPPPDTDIPLATLAQSWAYTGGIVEHEAERLCHAFAETNLVEEFRRYRAKTSPMAGAAANRSDAGGSFSRCAAVFRG